MLPLKTISGRECALVIVFLVNLVLIGANGSKGKHLGGFTIKDDAEDLLALPSDQHEVPAMAVLPAPNLDRNGPITSYAQHYDDNKAEESYGTGNVVSVLPGNAYTGTGTHYNKQLYHQQESYPGSSHYSRPTVLQQKPSIADATTPPPAIRSGGSGKLLAQESVQYPQTAGQYPQASVQYPQASTHYTQASARYPQSSAQYPQASVQYPQAQASQTKQFTSVDHLQKQQQQPQAQVVPVPVSYIPTGSIPFGGYSTLVKEPFPVDQIQAYVPDSFWNEGHDQSIVASTFGTGADLYDNALNHPLDLVQNLFVVFKKFAVPKDHYLRVISFVGVYLFMSILFYGSDDILQQKCEMPHKHQEWHYHVGRRFVPGMPVDEKMQHKFLELFRGMHLEDDGSSSEEGSGEMAGISALCPKGTFFYSLSPMHLEARMQVQKMFVAQKTPRDVYNLAKDLLYKYKIHPKIWYLGLVAAALERPDMTGFKLPHPLDAIPDWFIPAHLIKDEMDSYYGGGEDRDGRSRRFRRAVEGNSTITLVKTSANSTTTTTTTTTSTTTTTKAPKTKYTRRTTTTRPLPDSLESSSVETFILDGVNKDQNYLSYDEEKINQSIRNYAYAQKYKSKKKKKGTVSAEAIKIDDYKQPPKTTTQTSPRNKPKPVFSAETQETIYYKPAAPISNEYLDLAYDDKNDKKHGKHKGDKGDRDHKKKGHDKRKGKKKGKGKGKDSDEDEKECIVVDGKVGKDNGIENALWYFREDLQVNQQHWYWHLTHPANATVHADRRAELFFFTHRSYLARYNSERLSNGLHRTSPLHLGPGGIVHEPYHSHLADVSSGKYWTPRHAKQRLTDIIHIHNPDISKNILIRDVASIYDRLIHFAKTGIAFGRAGLVSLHSSKGIEPLGNTVEATELSINPVMFDAQGLHNLGHLSLGLVEDPDWKYKRPPGVMSEVSTSMRDPIFYTYHMVIDHIFELHKQTLPPYKVVGGEFPLLWKGVEIVGIELHSKGESPPNQLKTFWSKKKFELAPSVDGSTDQEHEHAHVCAKHLAHEPFTFKVIIDRKPCAKSKSGKGTVRIFMAPRYDEKGRRFHLREQRRMMFQLDAFQAELRVGRNVITRRSHDSSLTKPWTKSMRDYEEGPDPSGAAEFCGCGWPQHLYIPKGTPKGMPFDLFVMVTNYDQDHVENHPKDLEIPEPCNSPYLFCGHPRRRYPDRRPMGYPFDRPPYKTPIPCYPGYSFGSVVCKSFNLVFNKPIDTLEEFTSRAPNMKNIVFDIKHIDKVMGNYH